MIRKTLLLAVFMLLSAPAAQVLADNNIFQWTDENGQIHFGNRKSPATAQPVSGKPANTFNSDSAAELPLPELPATKPLVEMYATDWCGYCNKAREYFTANRIPFTEYDIEKNAVAKLRYDRFGGQGVPVIFIDGKRANGFNAQNFAQRYQSAINKPGQQ